MDTNLRKTVNRQAPFLSDKCVRRKDGLKGLNSILNECFIVDNQVFDDTSVGTCCYCGMQVPRALMADHRRTHRDEMQYACDFCGRRFHRKFVMLNHRRIHTGEKPFCCKTCRERFTTRSHMVQHSHKEGHSCD